MSLDDRMQALGRSLGEREAAHHQDMTRAQEVAARLRSQVEAALRAFQIAAEEAGAPTLGFEVGEPRLDDKHIRAIEFDLRRGRHGGIVTVKSKGEVTLVGPFRIGKVEGPCASFPVDAEDDLQRALGDFLERFAEAAMTP